MSLHLQSYVNSTLLTFTVGSTLKHPLETAHLHNEGIAQYLSSLLFFGAKIVLSILYYEHRTGLKWAPAFRNKISQRAVFDRKWLKYKIRQLWSEKCGEMPKNNF